MWLDVLTPKQAYLASCIAEHAKKLGHKVMVTARDFDFTLGVLERNRVPAMVVGRYGGGTLLGKLTADVDREAKLADIVAKERPDVLICYPSPAAVRVAFGLGVRILVISDSPHSGYASRLTIPLADVLVHSAFIPSDKFRAYVLNRFTRIVTYKGVDEVAWIRGLKPSPSVLEELELEPFNYVVVRPEESMAAYYRWKGMRLAKLAADICSKVKVVFLPRYGSQADELLMLSKCDRSRLAILQPPGTHGPSLEYYAAAVVTGGGTMAREAALLGVPGLNLFPEPLDVDEALRRLGFPLYHVPNLRDALVLLNKIIKDPEEWRVDTSDVLQMLESPVEVVLRELARYERGA